MVGMVMTHGIAVPRKGRWVTEQLVFDEIAVCDTHRSLHAGTHTHTAYIYTVLSAVLCPIEALDTLTHSQPNLYNIL